jgi:hypothetical protein
VAAVLGDRVEDVASWLVDSFAVLLVVVSELPVEVSGPREDESVLTAAVLFDMAFTDCSG